MNKLYLGKLSVSWSHRTVRSLEMSDTKRLFKSASQNKKKSSRAIYRYRSGRRVSQKM